ncbi:unnamed protein product [Medioppia subpectinata]|uniref:Uncharacterized protein n=1 Tax=Medioppia subpectinata TaxID=1979941 RepID=A0A7R9LKW6_9ACAR|nr:unnamed protein product [Medioppia subpectinata]CAG2119714.1 unnamed protein product [Medioppia subpectinata]
MANVGPIFTWVDIPEYEIQFLNGTGSGLYEQLFYDMRPQSRPSNNFNALNLTRFTRFRQLATPTDNNVVRLARLPIDHYAITNTLGEIRFEKPAIESFGKALKTDEILTKIIENNADIELRETIEKTVETIHKTEITFYRSFESYGEIDIRTRFASGFSFSFFGLFEPKIDFEIESQFKSGFRSLSIGNKSYSDFRRQLFTLKTDINVKPFMNISIKGLMKSVKDMEIEFTAVHTFTGTDPRGDRKEPLDGLTLFLLIGKEDNRHGVIINNDSLVINQKGLYRGTFGIETYTRIKQLKLASKQDENKLVYD